MISYGSTQLDYIYGPEPWKAFVRFAVPVQLWACFYTHSVQSRGGDVMWMKWLLLGNIAIGILIDLQEHLSLVSIKFRLEKTSSLEKDIEHLEDSFWNKNNGVKKTNPEIFGRYISSFIATSGWGHPGWVSCLHRCFHIHLSKGTRLVCLPWRISLARKHNKITQH